MQIHSTYNKREKEYCNLRLILNCALFQKYEVKLPETEIVKILLADISDLIDNEIQSEWYFQANEVKVERIDDVRRWIYEVAVYKKMREIEGNNKVLTALQPFDVLIWKKKQQFYGAYTTEISKDAKINSQLNAKFITKIYKSQLADYHSFNIILQNVDEDCLCWNVTNGRPFLKLSSNWKSVDYQEGHWYWSEAKEDPYSQDFRRLQQTIEKIFNLNLELPKEQGQLKPNNSKLIHLKQFYSTIYQQSYEDFIKKYTKIFGAPFIAKNNESFSDNLKEFYNMKNEYHYLMQVLHQQKTQYQAQTTINAESIKKLHSITLQEKIVNSEYPCFVQKIIHGTSKKQTLENILKVMGKQTKQDRVRWHFLKAKIEWKAGNFYRALAHLRQARSQTNDPKLLYIIKFQQARNWQHLGQVDKAETYYKQSIAYAEQINPAMCQYLLATLKCLYWKQGKIEQINAIDQKIKDFKRISVNHKIAKTPQVRCMKAAENTTQIISSIMKLDKEEKTLSKTQLMKLQTQRAPFLLSIWTHLKPLFDKSKSQKVSNSMHHLVYISNNLLGELKLDMYLLILLNYIQNRNQCEFMQNAIEQIVQQLDQLQKNNLKNYHRFLFLLSFYFQYKQPEKAMKFIQTILQSKTILYSKVARFSLVKRLVQLYKQQNKQQKLLMLYQAQNVIESGDLQCLYDFIQISAQAQHYTSVVYSGIIYLNSIKQYQTETSIIKAKQTGRLVNLSFEVRLLILRSFGKLRCYDDLARIMQQLESDLNDRNKDIKLFILQMGNLCLQMYQAGEYQLCYSFIKKLVHYHYIAQQQSQNQQKTNQLLKQFDIQRLHRVYNQILVKLNIVANDTDFKWFQLNSPQRDSQIIDHSRCQRDAEIIKIRSIKSIVEVLKYELKQRQPNLIKIFQQFHALTITHQTPQLFGQLVNQTIIIGKKQGIQSYASNIMYILLLNTSLKQEKRATEMYLLYWLSSFKTNFELAEAINDYWASKEGRDLRLDEMLFDYFEDRIQKTQCHTLQQLSWFQSTKQSLIVLKNQYKEIVCCELGVQDQKLQLKIFNFEIKYRTLFDSVLQQSDVLIKMEEIMAQLDCPDDYL